MPDHAVDVLDAPASRTNQMVVVVADPRFVQGGGVCGFDAAHQTGVEEGVEVVVHGLPGKAADMLPRRNRDGVGVVMPARNHGGKHGKAGRGYAHSDRPQFFLERFRVS